MRSPLIGLALKGLVGIALIALGVWGLGGFWEWGSLWRQTQADAKKGQRSSQQDFGPFFQPKGSPPSDWRIEQQPWWQEQDRQQQQFRQALQQPIGPQMPPAPRSSKPRQSRSSKPRPT